MKKGVHFLAKGVAKMFGCKAAEKERSKEKFSRLDANYFCQRESFWDTPVYYV